MLKEDDHTTNELSSNSKVQLEQMSLLSSMFSKGEIRAIWVPSKLNISNLIKRESVDPIRVVNSAFYREAKLPTGECLTDMLEKLTNNNTFLKYKDGTLILSPVEDAVLEDCGFYDRSRQRTQLKKASQVQNLPDNSKRSTTFLGTSDFSVANVGGVNISTNVIGGDVDTGYKT